MGIRFLPLGKLIKFIIIWGIGSKDSNLSFEYREADEDFSEKVMFEAVINGPVTPIFPVIDQSRILYSIYVDVAGSVTYTDITGAQFGSRLLADSVTHIGGKAASDTLFFKPTAPITTVGVTAWHVQRQAVEI